MTWLDDVAVLLKHDDEGAKVLATVPPEHQPALIETWLDLCADEPLQVKGGLIELAEVQAFAGQLHALKTKQRAFPPEEISLCGYSLEVGMHGFAFASPHPSYDCGNPAHTALWLQVCQAGMLVTTDSQDHLRQATAKLSPAAALTNRKRFQMDCHLEWWEALCQHGMGGWYPAEWKRRADDDQWVVALYGWLAAFAWPERKPNEQRTLASGLDACHRFMQQHGAHWRRALVSQAGQALVGAVQLALHNREPWAILAFLGRTTDALEFKHWSELRTLAYALGDETKPWLGVEDTTTCTHLHAYARLVQTFGSRTMPVVRARLAKRVVTDVEAPVEVESNLRSRLYAISVLTAPPYHPEAVDWMFAHKDAKNWDEVLSVGYAWEAVTEAATDMTLGAMQQRLNSVGGSHLLAAYRVPEDSIKRWKATHNTSRGTYPTALKVTSGKFQGSVLKRQDARGILFGHFTSCCQHVGGHAAGPAWHSQESPYGGVFGVQMAHHLFAGSWLWVQPHANYRGLAYAVFDSLEVKVEWRDKLARQPRQIRELWALYFKAALELYCMYPELVGVLIGPPVIPFPFQLEPCAPWQTTKPFLQRYARHCYTDIARGGSWLIPPEFAGDLEHRQGVQVLRPHTEVLDSLGAVVDKPDALLSAVEALHHHARLGNAPVPAIP